MLGGPVAPALRARVGVGRAGGWLAGGPDPARPADVARTPSLRRGELELDLPSLDGNGASGRVVLHEASALGVTRTLWEISHSGEGDPLLPEVDVLLGRLAAALGPLPAGGAARVLVDLLSGLGLMDPAALATGATPGFNGDAVRRLLVDPAGLVLDADAATLAPALTTLLGGAAPGAPGVATARIGEVSVELDVATGDLTVGAADVDTGAGFFLGGSLTRSGGATAVTVSVALGAGDTPNGRPVIGLAASDGPLSLVCRWEGGGSTFPTEVPLAPDVDADGLMRILLAALPAQILTAGITFVRSLPQPGMVALVDPALRLLGLLHGDGDAARPVVPAALLADPGHWFTHASVLGRAGGGVDPGRLAALLDLTAALLAIDQPQPGAWSLPYGAGLAAGSTAGVGGGQATLTLDIAEPAGDTGLRVAGSVGLILGTPASVTAELSVALPGTDALDAGGHVSVAVGPTGLTARLVIPASGIDIALWPPGPGLAALGTAAVTYALPFALDAITDLPPSHPARPVGVALASLGTALALRPGNRFSGPELQLLGADPAGELARRLSGALTAGLDALAALLAPALPAGYSLTRAGNELVFRRAGPVQAELHLTVPGGGVPGGLTVTGSIAGLTPLPGAELGGTLSASAAGLTEATVTFAVDPAAALAVGPIELAPTAEVAIGSAPAGGVRVAAGLALDGGRRVQGVLRFGPPATFAVEATGAPLAEVLADLLVPVAVDLALSTDEVQDLLRPRRARRGEPAGAARRRGVLPGRTSTPACSTSTSCGPACCSSPRTSPRTRRRSTSTR